jgi:hypothetical protein
MVEVCMIVVTISAVVAALALVVIASKLHWVIVYLMRLTEAIDQLRTSQNSPNSASPAGEDAIKATTEYRPEK